MKADGIYTVKNKDFIYDIEFYQNFFCVNFLSYPDREERVSFEISSRKDQRKELLEFLEYDGEFVPETLRLIGYNNIGYDYPVLHMLIENPEISLLIWWKKVQRDIFNNQDRKNMIWENQRHVFQIDVFKINHYDNVARSASLKWLEFTQRWHKVQDLPINPKALVQETQMDSLIRYCWNDVEFTAEVADYTWNAVKFRENMGDVLGRSVMDYSDVQIGQFLNQKKYEEISDKKYKDFKQGRTFRKNYQVKDIVPDMIEFKTPFMQKFLEDIKKITFTDDDIFRYDIIINAKGEFERISKGVMKSKEIKEEWQKLSTIITFARGGLHTIDMPRIVDREEGHRLMEKDVGSMYPRSIVVDGIYPRHLGIEWNMGIEDAYNYRMDTLKPRMKELEYGSEEWKKINDEQEVYKLAMNGGGFGKLGSAYSWQYDPLAKYQVTMGCELKLLMLIEDFVMAGVKIISVNTDGVVIQFPKSMQSIVDDIHKAWEEKTSFILEDTHYNKLVFSSVNDYIAVIVDGESDEVEKVKYKGDFEIDKDAHKNNSQRVIAIALSEYFIKGVPLTDCIGHLGYKFGKDSQVDIYDYCIGKKKTSSCEYWWVRKGKAEQLTDKVIRFYVGKSGDYLLKKYTKGAREGKYEKVNAQFHHTLFMDYFPAANMGGNYKIDTNYYMNECRKLIAPIESGTRLLERGAYIQGELF